MAKALSVSERERFERAINSDLPKLYFNGFVNNLSGGDVATALELNGQPVAILNMSFTVAKTLSASLGTLISTLEEASGRDMLTTHQVAAGLEQLSEKRADASGKGKKPRSRQKTKGNGQ